MYQIVKNSRPHHKSFYENKLSLDFDGSNDYVNCGNDSSLKPTGAMTLSWWQNGAGISSFYCGLGTYGSAGSRGYFAGMKNSGGSYRFQFYIAENDTDLIVAGVNSFATPGSWVFVTCVYDPSTALRVYKDGVEVATNTTSIPASQYQNSRDFLIGESGLLNGNYFDGYMDEVAIWGAALSQSEIDDIYNSGAPANLLEHSAAANLISWWRMGDGDTYPVIRDKKGPNEGAMTNMASDDIQGAVP